MLQIEYNMNKKKKVIDRYAEVAKRKEDISQEIRGLFV